MTDPDVGLAYHLCEWGKGGYTRFGVLVQDSENATEIRACGKTICIRTPPRSHLALAPTDRMEGTAAWDLLLYIILLRSLVRRLLCFSVGGTVVAGRVLCIQNLHASVSLNKRSARVHTVALTLLSRLPRS